MNLRRSRFVHVLPVGTDRYLVVHAVNHMRLPVDRDVKILLDFFEQPRTVPDDCEALTKNINFSLEAIQDAVLGLVKRQVLTDKTPDEELEMISTELAPTHGRDPAQLLELYRRQLKQGSSPYWSVSSTLSMPDLHTTAQKVVAILFGDCDIQMEADFFRREATRRNIDLHISATFPYDIRYASEHKHDVIFIGALRARYTITETPEPGHAPHTAYIEEARYILTQMREHSSAPILIDNLPLPTVQPLGIAEQGANGHRNRFRMANVALAELVATMKGVYIMDVSAALGNIGADRMIDDGLFSYTHFGSPGWLLQRPAAERAAVHDIFPDVTPLARWVGGDPYGRESALATLYVDALITVLGIGRKKCVILDLDGTLWPGVLAETGSPFSWSPEISGVFSYIGLYFGLHEALLALKKRGIVLACVSKNDEATVRELWKYPDHYPKKRLLTPDDFVTWRVNWNDKVDNIVSIAEELGFALDSFLFIDDNPVERGRVRQRIPDVEVWGEDPFSLRRCLLNDPRLQLPLITEESAIRSDLVKAQLKRQTLRKEFMDDSSYLALLNIQCKIERLWPGAQSLTRVEELFQRTTQFNATGRKFSSSELSSFVESPSSYIITINISDSFGDHGLVGAVVISEGEILGLAMSCRVLGMGVENTFVQNVLKEIRATNTSIIAKIIETSRNIPVRNIYRDNGFTEIEPGVWQRSLENL